VSAINLKIVNRKKGWASC